jgi:uncharacterized protein YebE (UPF0316 family)
VENSTFTTPLLIFFAEVCALTASTMRIIFVARGHKFLAPLLGFFEIMIWLFAIGETMRNLDNWTCFIAFALGFTLGNYLGIVIDKRLALGTAIVRIITNRDATALVAEMRAANFGVTALEGNGAKGKVQIVMTVVKRKQLEEIVSLIDEHQPGAFYAVEDLQSAREGIFPARKDRLPFLPQSIVSALRSMMPQEQDELAGQGDRKAHERIEEAREPEAAAFR